MSTYDLVYPHGELTGNDVMIDYLDDNLRRLKRYLESVDDECLHWLIDPESISIATILWHMGRILDVFFTQLALGYPSEKECWIAGGWVEKTGYDPRGLGRDGWGSLNEYTLEEVAAIPKLTKEQYINFLEEVYKTVGSHLKSTPMSELAKPGAGFKGQFTRYQVISMALMDNVRHLGEIRLIKSLWTRAQPEF
jgi:hypothetical protein